jgi:hypothetical protein
LFTYFLSEKREGLLENCNQWRRHSCTWAEKGKLKSKIPVISNPKSRDIELDGRRGCIGPIQYFGISDSQCRSRQDFDSRADALAPRGFAEVVREAKPYVVIVQNNSPRRVVALTLSSSKWTDSIAGLLWTKHFKPHGSLR